MPVKYIFARTSKSNDIDTLSPRDRQVITLIDAYADNHSFGVLELYHNTRSRFIYQGELHEPLLYVTIANGITELKKRGYLKVIGQGQVVRRTKAELAAGVVSGRELRKAQKRYFKNTSAKSSLKTNPEFQPIAHSQDGVIKMLCKKELIQPKIDPIPNKQDSVLEAQLKWENAKLRYELKLAQLKADYLVEMDELKKGLVTY